MTDEILSLALRPRTLSGLVGQKNLTTAIRAQMRSKRRPRAWMFTGQSGGGKTTIASIVALSLQCEHQTPDTWGDPCEVCWKQRSDYSILEINASEVSGVEEIGKIASDSKLRPMPPSKYRVYILDEAQLLTNNSQSLLLKPFVTKMTIPDKDWTIAYDCIICLRCGFACRTYAEFAAHWRAHHS